jgi:hypothetical protein
VRLGERDAVDGGVELPVARAAESVPLPVGRPDWQRGGAVVAGVGVAALEAFDACVWVPETRFRSLRWVSARAQVKAHFANRFATLVAREHDRGTADLAAEREPLEPAAGRRRD